MTLQALKKDDVEVVSIENFVSLVNVFTDSTSFADWEYKEESDKISSLYSEGLTAFFFAEEEWTSNIDSILRYVGSPGVAIVLVGDTKKLPEVDARLQLPEVHQLCTPVSVNGIQALLRSLLSFHQISEKQGESRREQELSSENVKKVLSISRELNGVRDVPKLLNLILKKAREITKADAGSIYTVEHTSNKAEEQKLRFRYTQNDSLEQNLSEFELPINDKSVVGNAVLQRVSINIEELYDLDPDPSKNPYNARHDKSWDLRTGYESHSMLTLPMFDISHNVVGVIQLINRKKDASKLLRKADDFAEQVMPFEEHDLEYAEIVAQQAGIALENANMQEEIQQLFDGFVDAAVTAIEQRDPTTSGHSHRVALLTVDLAKTIDHLSDGTFSAIRFSEDQIREINYASLLHDFGKLGVRENVLVKAKKLFPMQYDLIQERFELIKATYEIEFLRNSINLLKRPNAFPMGVSEDSFLAERNRKLDELEYFWRFVRKANEPTVLEQGGFELLKDIANCTFRDLADEERPFLLGDELKALAVSRGSLTREEFAEIQSHVTHTFEFLRKIPWGSKLSNIPQIALKHHEKLDGSGYPTSAEAHEIPIQSRMMTIADIFDALTAADRPYKKALPFERALDILGMEVKGGKIDPDLFEVFVESKIYEKVAP